MTEDEIMDYDAAAEYEAAKADREAYEALCVEYGIKPDHDETCDPDNPCGECRADEEAERLMERRFGGRR